MFFWDDADQLPAVRLIPTSFEVELLVREGLRRCEEWKQLRQMYPAREIRFRRNASFGQDVVLEDTFVKSVYDLIDGTKTVADIDCEKIGCSAGVPPALLLCIVEFARRGGRYYGCELLLSQFFHSFRRPRYLGHKRGRRLAGPTMLWVSRPFSGF